MIILEHLTAIFIISNPVRIYGNKWYDNSPCWSLPWIRQLCTRCQTGSL